MTANPHHIAAVCFHLEGALAADRGRGLEAALERRAARAIILLLLGKGLRLGVLSSQSRAAVRDFLKQELRIPPAELKRLSIMGGFGKSARSRSRFRSVAGTMRCAPERLMLVSADPVLLRQAQAAGTVTAGWGDTVGPDPGSSLHYRIGELSALPRIVRRLTPLPAGKLPNDLLRELLGEFRFEDPSLLINPGVGEDIAAVDVKREEVLILKSDPITFATDAIGRYAVLVNANDIATAGATPRWLLTTLLFPVGSTPALVWSVANDLMQFCGQWGITLCGGHTEVTEAVSRPVVCGMMAGSVARRRLIDKRGMRCGDRLLLTKAAAVEGTAIVAREFAGRLRRLGMSASEIRACQGFLDRISILPEARLAARCPGTSAMHDVTEGGIATAIEELSAAGGFRLRVELDRIPVFPETRRLCRLLDLHPLGLIGSGSLLICCRPHLARGLEKFLRQAEIPVACIGKVAERGSGVQAFKAGRRTPWPRFEVDEIARLFAGKGRPRRRLRNLD